MNEVQRLPLKQEKRAPSPPEIKGNLILGVMSDFNRDILAFVTRGRQYGDVVRARFFYVTAYFLYHPDDVEQVLSVQAKNFEKSMSLRSNFFQRLVGNGLLTSEGEFWRRQRRLAQPAFHRQRISTYADVMVDYTTRLIQPWRAGEERFIDRDMMRLTMEIVVQTLFSSTVSTDADRVGQVLAELVKPFASQATLKWILDNRLPTPSHRRFHKLVAEIDELIFRLISERRQSGRDEGDLLSMLLAAQDEDGSQMTDQQLRDEVITLFLAGQETTALTLSWAWYLLAQSPDVEKKLHEEIDQLEGRPPAMDDVPRLKYTDMILKEVMRLYPPAYGVGRSAIADCELGGFHVPAKTQVFAFQWAIHRDPRFFAEPDRFHPERWTDEFTANLPKYAYFPFGGGPRICIGNTFAMMEMVLVMATIAQKFRFRMTVPRSVEIEPAMSLRPRGGIPLVIESRSD